MLIKHFVLLAMRAINKYCGVDANPYLFIVSLLFTILIAVFIEWLSCKDKFKWISWLWAN